MAFKSRKSGEGYATTPNLPPYPPCSPYPPYPPYPPVPPMPPPPPPRPIPPGMTVQDWMMYINSYIDVRARQLYDKLKELYNRQDQKTRDYVLLKDASSGEIYKVYVDNGEIQLEKNIEPEPDPQPDSTEIEIDQVVFDELNVKDLKLKDKSIENYFCHFDDETTPDA